jgi:hypothetical protein
METAYIRFEAPQSVRKTKSERSFKRSIKRVVINLLTKIIPTANPDYEDKISKVRYWLIECDSISGVPQREIGLDSQGGVIMKMPFNKNYGYWTDNNLLLDGFKQHFNVSEITQEIFEQHWKLVSSNVMPG